MFGMADLSPRARAAATVGERLAELLRAERSNRLLAENTILERDSEDEGERAGL